jgi:hypothetical protein
MKNKTSTKQKREFRFHDPKIVPPPEEGVNITVEYTMEELEAIKEAVRQREYWSLEEFFRAADADFVRKHTR